MRHMSECSASVLYTQKRSSFSSSSPCCPHPCSWLSHPGTGASCRPHRIPTGEQPLSLLIQPVMSDTLKTLKLTLVFGTCLLTKMTVYHTLCWLWYYMRPDLKKHHLFFFFWRWLQIQAIVLRLQLLHSLGKDGEFWWIIYSFKSFLSS